jgi:formylglycine-generating enzyme required for sulfatase activity
LPDWVALTGDVPLRCCLFAGYALLTLSTRPSARWALSTVVIVGCAALPAARAPDPSSFELDVTEVTVDAYRSCVEAGVCGAPAAGENCNWGLADRANHPINCVDWRQATTYCGWAGKRLPTEEEWEVAARGVLGREVPWGNEPPGKQLCWGPTSGGHTCPVGSFPAGDNPEGVKDLAGNVWEWTSSAYAPSNPSRVARGASWDNGHASYVRSAYRGRYPAEYRDADLGFRCARSR